MMLHENIRDIRKRKGLTQEDLAEAMGVSAASVSKWETGQSVPEVYALCALAEYFEVSVDALLGHMVMSDRKEQMLSELENLKKEREFDRARDLAEKLLRCYPNSYDVVDGAADLHYSIFVFSGEKQAMETANSLVMRLFSLAEGGEKSRLELLSRLANQYELMGNWEMARKYYEEGNVSGVNDRQLAHLQAREKGDSCAITKISDIFAANLFQMVTDVLKLNELWQAQGEREKAIAALQWGVQAMECCGSQLCREYTPVLVSLYLNLVGMDDAHAEEYVRKIALLSQGKLCIQVPEFLENKDAAMIASQVFYDNEFVKNILIQIGAEEYIPVAEEAMKV